MLIKSNWHWINFIFMILLNHMFQLGSADLNNDQIQSNDEMINLKFNTLKQMANNLKLQFNNNTGKETGYFYRPGSRNSINIDKLNVIFIRIGNIEQDISASAGKHGDSETIKVRVNELENEIKNLRISLDNICLDNMQYQNNLNFLAIIAEPQFSKELEEQLMKRDYTKAKLKADMIVCDDRIIDVMKKVYEKQKDIDGYLYFAGIVENLSRRLVIYRYINNDIILEMVLKYSDYVACDKKNCTDCGNDSEMAKLPFLFICNSLKLMNKLESSVIKMAPVSSDIYTSANNLKVVCEAFLKIFFEGMRRKLEVRLNEEKEFQNITSNYLVSDSRAMLYGYDKSTSNREKNVFEFGFYLDNLHEKIIDCWFNIKLLFKRDVIMNILLRNNQTNYVRSEEMSIHNNRIKLSNYGIMFILSLKEKNYILAVYIYNSLKSNNNEIVNAIKQYFNEFQDVDTILQFVDILTHNDRVVIYNALYDAIDKTDIVNMCDMLKLHDSLINFSNSNQLLTIINNLKKAITLIIKNDVIGFMTKFPEMENRWSLVESDYNEIIINSKYDNKVIGKIKFYLVKENGKSYCYFDGNMSLNFFLLL